MTNTIDIYVDGSAINNENPNVPTLGGVGIFVDLSKSPEDENAKGSYGIFVGHVKDHKLEDDNNYTDSAITLRTLNLGKTTNNTTELAAIYVALVSVEHMFHPSGREFMIYGDSEYAGNLIFGNWNPKENKQLVAIVKQKAKSLQNAGYKIRWEHVRAHADDDRNNYVDYLAKCGAYNTPLDDVQSFSDWTTDPFDDWKMT